MKYRTLLAVLLLIAGLPSDLPKRPMPPIAHRELAAAPYRFGPAAPFLGVLIATHK